MTDVPAPPGLSGRLLAALYLAAVAIPLALAAAWGAGASDPWTEAASGLGIAAGAMLALQFATSGRFAHLSGRIGIDQTMAFHKWAARGLVVAVVLHPLVYALPAFAASPDRGLAYLHILFTAPRYQSGVVAWGATLLVVLLAVLRDRLRVPYEAWRASHAVLGAIAVIGVADHALRAGSHSDATPLAAFWIGAAVAAIGSLAVVYLWRTAAIRRDPWRLVANEKVGRGLWRLAFRRDSGQPFTYRAGQFVWLVTAPRLFPLFDHPFSVSSSPRDPELELIVKEAGDYTGKIGALPPGTRAGIDGPHGAFVREGHDAEAILLVAGGAGIAPVLGVLRDLDRADDRRPIRLVIAAAGPDRLVARDEIADIAARRDLKRLFVVEKAEADFDGETGLIDRARFDRVTEGLPRARTLAMICGPGGFMAAAADHLLALGFAPGNVLYERFDYADKAMSRLDRAQLARFRLIGAAAAAAVLAFALRGVAG